MPARLWKDCSHPRFVGATATRVVLHGAQSTKMRSHRSSRQAQGGSRRPATGKTSAGARTTGGPATGKTSAGAKTGGHHPTTGKTSAGAKTGGHHPTTGKTSAGARTGGEPVLAGRVAAGKASLDKATDSLEEKCRDRPCCFFL